MTAALRAQAVAIYRQGLARITPEALLRDALRLEGDTLRLTFLDREERVALPAREAAPIFLLAVGKAAAPMAAEAARLLEGRIGGGLVVTKEGFALPGLPFPTRESAHPVPDARGLAAAEEVERMVAGLGPRRLLLLLVSGGASALLPAPAAGVTLAEKQAMAELMLRAAMDIHEINRVRKALSRFKGGGLAALAGEARTVGLYLSDVPGDDLGVIGSGPSVPEAVDAPGAIALLKAHGAWEASPPAARAVLEAGGAAKPLPRQPPVNGLIGTNRHLLRAMAEAARAAGFHTVVEERPTTGLNPAARDALLTEWQTSARDRPAGPLCRISGGETVVRVTGGGLGGRCQELAALMMARLPPDAVFLAAGSDGNDGPTDAAGGVVDRESHDRALAEGVPYDALLADHDSYHLLERTGNLIKVPPTRNNVMDVHLFLRGPADGTGEDTA